MRITLSNTITDEPYRSELWMLLHEGFRGVAHAGIEVHVRVAKAGYFSGRAYTGGIPGIARVAATSRHLITLKVPQSPTHDALRYPYLERYRGMASDQGRLITNWRESFLFLVAHEASHVRQARTRARRASGHAKQSERRAQAWADRVLAHWRCWNSYSCPRCDDPHPDYLPCLPGARERKIARLERRADLHDDISAHPEDYYGEEEASG